MNSSATPQHHELLRCVASDLKFLRTACEPNATEDDLRRSSTTLRNLLVYRWIQTAWHELGLQPRAPQVRTEQIIPLSPGSSQEVQFAGTVDFPGVSIGHVSIVHGETLNDQQARDIFERFKRAEERPFRPLSEFVEGTCILAEGMKVSRRQVVSYVANKLGGAHLDKTRKKDDDTYRLLDRLAAENRFMGSDEPDGPEGLSGVYKELLSIGQSLNASPDMERLEAACEQAIKR